MNTERWLNEIDGGKSLFSLNLPATHNSAARFVKGALIRCQDMSIKEQLESGIRVFDLRVKSEGERLVLVHSFANIYSDEKYKSVMHLGEIIADFNEFLNNNPSETVVLQFKNDSEKEQQKCIDILKSRYIERGSWYLEPDVPTLNQARGKIVLLRRCIDAKDSLGIDVSLWVDQGKREAKALLLQSKSGGFLIQDRYSYSPKKKWSLCVKPLLESAAAFSKTYILNYLSTAGGLHLPRQNANIINKCFTEYELKNNKYYGILYLDFPGKDVINKIINTNF
ncbi:MAG: phosphatidylinositol-specific phospholipase C domain-containing protein [Eubacterium sp.]|nr:phosphatidylinositol-specific phospholipase C domain-containing protein [Eubacterium sp.]